MAQIYNANVNLKAAGVKVQFTPGKRNEADAFTKIVDLHIIRISFLHKF